jgi:competence protein ComEC
MLILSFSQKRFLSLALLLGYLSLTVAYRQLPDGKNHLYFFDIGQGDSVFFQSKDNYQVLVDGGPNSLILERLSDVMPFFDKSIDLVVLSHPHSDHLSGLIDVLEHFEVANILITGVNYNSKIYEHFLKILNDSKDSRVLFANTSFDLTLGESYLDIIYPDSSLILKNIDNLNNSSIVLKLLIDDLIILLAGDIESEIELHLLSTNVNLKADIFKVSHHGSKSSSLNRFLQAVSPRFAIIQAGQNNQYGHPHEETLDKLAQIKNLTILRNDLDKTIEFSW